jgi:hypothetical protein
MQHRRIQTAAKGHQQLAVVKGLRNSGKVMILHKKCPARYRALSHWQELLLIKLQRQAVRIVKKGKAFAGKRIDTNRFTGHAMRFQMLPPIDIINAESQMTQPTGFRAARTRRRKREREQLNHILAVQRQIALPGVALLAIELALQRKAQNVAVEGFTLRVIGRNDGNMVNPF